MRVHVADRDGDALWQACPARRPRGQRARAAAERQHGVRELLVGETGEVGVQGGEVLPGRVVPVLEDALIPGGARVPRLGAGELPDDPVRGLDPPLREPVDVRVLLEQLERLGELPLGGDLPAVPGQPRLTAVAGHLGDPVGLRLGGVMLPELGIGVRAAGELGELAQRRPVFEHRQHGAGGEVGADADHLAGADAGHVDRGGHRGAQHVQVVCRVLQRPVGGQRPAGGCQLRVHHAVPVLADRAAELRAVGDADDQGAPGQGAEIDADHAGVLTARARYVNAHIGILWSFRPGPRGVWQRQVAARWNWTARRARARSAAVTGPRRPP